MSFALIPLDILSCVRFFLCAILLSTHLVDHGVESVIATPCNQTFAEQRSVVITPSTASDLNLSSIFNCLGGSFEVSWSGSVAVTDSILIGGGTSVTIVGSSSNNGDKMETAAADSAVVAATAFGPIFVVDNAELVIKGLVVRGGNASRSVGTGETRGAGVHAVAANLIVERCAFYDNFAEESGGGIRASLSRVVVRETVFSNCSSGPEPGAGSTDASGEGGGIEVTFVLAVACALYMIPELHI